jgi:hypothetical protein
MISRFRVLASFSLPKRNLFVLSGVIREGLVDMGMKAELRVDDEVLFQEAVHSVEFMEHEGAGLSPCLTFEYRDLSQLSDWLSLPWEKQIVAVRL